MKANFIIGKKQIILSSLVLILGVAVYLNWSFAKNDNQFEATDVVNSVTQDDNDIIESDTDGMTLPEIMEEQKIANVVDEIEGVPVVTDEETEKSEEGTIKHLGDAQLVSAKIIVDDNYFVKAKLERSRSRDLAIETISTILDDEQLTEGDKKQATEKAISITDIIETESKIENLVKAKGYEECMAYISGDNATVVVKADMLDQIAATQIKNIVVQEGVVKGENVSITEIN